MERSLAEELAIEPIREGVFRARLAGLRWTHVRRHDARLRGARGGARLRGQGAPLAARLLPAARPAGRARSSSTSRSSPKGAASRTGACSCACEGRVLCEVSASFAAPQDGRRLPGSRAGSRRAAARGADARRRAGEDRGLAGPAAAGRVALDRVSRRARWRRARRRCAAAGRARARRFPTTRACTKRRSRTSATGPRRAPSSAASRPASPPSASRASTTPSGCTSPRAGTTGGSITARSDIAAAGRALTLREVYTREGRRIATIAQEALIGEHGEAGPPAA